MDTDVLILLVVSMYILMIQKNADIAVRPPMVMDVLMHLKGGMGMPLEEMNVCGVDP
jgi:hypothetical protein